MGDFDLNFDNNNNTPEVLLFFAKSSTYYTAPQQFLYYYNNSVTDPTYKTQINVSLDDRVMKCMLFTVLANENDYTAIVDTISIGGIGFNNLNPGDIIIRIYEITGDIQNVTEITTTNLHTDNLVAKYISAGTPTNTIDDGSNSFYVNCNPVGDKFTFSPTSYTKYYILGVQTLAEEAIYVYKSISYPDDTLSGSGNPILITDHNTLNNNIKSTEYFTFDSNNSDVVVSKQVGGVGDTAMGCFAVGMRGTLTQNNPVCFHGNSLVHTDNGVVYAKHITEEHKLTDGTNFYSINTIIKSTNCTDIVHIKRNSLGKDQPYTDFYVTRTHMIKIDDKELQAQELVNKYEGINLLQLENPCYVYSFITEKGDYVKINGLNVKTFNSNEFINFIN